MRQIEKGPEPPSLRRYRATPGARYKDFRDMDELREALLRDQRGLCCYCMGQIRAEQGAMKVEHWRCREHHKSEELSYLNLLGACMGGERAAEHARTCDTRKENHALKWNPADPNHRVESRIKYGIDGSIRSDDSEFDKQLEEVLNLNLTVLCRRRQAVYDAALAWWRKEQKRVAPRPVARDAVVRQIDHLSKGYGNLPSYQPVALWLLRQKLERSV